MTALEVKEYVDDILRGQFVLNKKRNTDCEYMRNGKCLATTHETCVKCKVFSPNYLAKMKKLADLYCEMKDIKEELVIAKKEIDHLNRYITDMKIAGLTKHENTGKRYRYGMRLRGFSPGAQPDSDRIVDRYDDPTGKYYDILIYDKVLTEKQLAEYEMDFLGGDE